MASPLLFSAAPGVLAWLGADDAERHVITAQLLTADEARRVLHLSRCCAETAPETPLP
jgi:hypothetical protein